MDGLSQHKRFKSIDSLRYPDLLDSKVNTLLNQSVAIASFLRFHAANSSESIPEKHFDQLLTDLSSGKTIAELYPRGLQLGEIEPTWSILINFIENLQRTSEKFNLRWHDYPKWYLKSIVGVKAQQRVGDKVWVVFTNNGMTSTLVPDKTKFKVGRENNKTYFYGLIGDTEVHNTEIDKLFLLNLEKKNESLEPYSLKSVHLDELIIKNNHIESVNKVNVEIGVRITSPILVLNEGIRNLQITFFPRHKEETKKTVQEIRTISSAFKLSISSANGWENINEYVVQEENGKITIELQLPDSFPSTSPCLYEVHRHNSFYPTLNVCLNLDSSDYLNSSLEKIQLSKVKVVAKVRNITNLKIYNELGKINNSKPFAPFGINTEKGAWFTLGNYESSIKDTKNRSEEHV